MAKAKSTTKGNLHVQATFNNTLVTIANDQGKVLDWTSCGRMGFKGTRKSTPFAATTTIQDAMGRVANLGIKRLQVYIKGPGPGRDAALRVLRGTPQVQVTMLSDVTPLPHNGPRPPKQRRG